MSMLQSGTLLFSFISNKGKSNLIKVSHTDELQLNPLLAAQQKLR